MECEKEVRERSREIEAATLPQLKNDFNESMEVLADRLLQLESEIAELKANPSRYDGTLSENDIIRVVGVILANDRLAEYLGQKIRDKFRDKVKVNFEIG